MTPLICGEVTKGNLIVNGILSFCSEIGPITHILLIDMLRNLIFTKMLRTILGLLISA